MYSVDKQYNEHVQIVTLSELGVRLRSAVQEAVPDWLWVKGEIARMTVHHQSGHCYLDLVEKQGAETHAQFRAMIWAGDYRKVAATFSKVTGEALRAGIAVLFLAKPVFHPVYGLSLQISGIEPSFTLGEMERIRRETIAQLKREGLFDCNREKPFPMLPQRLAVISAADSKGYSDFLTIMEQYPVRYRLFIKLFPALLQGDRAVESLLLQLHNIEAQYHAFDAVLIIRGGGDEIGMTCFDDAALSREVCRFPLPVVTGIGHSTNETIVEMVAGMNRITPTDVAYEILRRLDDARMQLEGLRDRLHRVSEQFIRNSHRQVMEQLGTLSARLHGVIMMENQKLEHFATAACRKAMAVVGVQGQRLEREAVLLKRAAGRCLAEHFGRLAAIEQKVGLLDPVNVLKRGYSLTFRADGSLAHGAADVMPSELLTTRFCDGTVASRVEEIKMNTEFSG